MPRKYRIIEGPESVQGTPEWHQFRKGKIGASDAASIMGVSPWETKLQCWERIQFGIKKAPNKAMERGTALESTARKWLNDKLGKDYQPVVVQSINNPDLIASLDGYYENFEGTPYILEIKVPGIEAHGDAVSGRVPHYYIPQLMHQMDLVGVNHMIYVSYYGNHGEILHVERDEEYCKKLFLEELSFMASLIDFRPPPAVDQDWVKIHHEEVSVKAERYRELSLLIDELEMECQDIKDYLTTEIDHPRSIIGDMKIQRITRRGSIEYDKIPELQNLDLEIYRKKPIDTWRFTF
jgi:putative phage-type endonuclease